MRRLFLPFLLIACGTLLAATPNSSRSPTSGPATASATLPPSTFINGFGGANAPLVNPAADPPLPPGSADDIAARMAARRASAQAAASQPALSTQPAAGGSNVSPINPALNPPQPPVFNNDFGDSLAARRAAQAAALAALAAQPAPPPRPATVRLTLLDPQGHPLPSTPITAALDNSNESPQTATSDNNGCAAFTFPVASDATNARFTVEQSGRSPYVWTVYLFEGARIVRNVQLIPSRKTLLHIRGPDGQPVEGVPLLCDGSYSKPLEDPYQVFGYAGQSSLTEVTDAHGDFLWDHWPHPGGIIITVGGRDAPRPLAAVRSPEVDELTITLSPEAFAQVFPTRILSLKLLHSDGTPANDWLVAGHVIGSGGITIVSGAAVGNSANYETGSLAHPGPDGILQIRAPTNFLGLISPEGFQFLYALNPCSWPVGIHRVTLTIPPARGALRTRLVDAAGIPLPNLPVTLSNLRSGNNDWGLSQQTPGRTGPIESGSIRSDADGWISIPQYVGTRFFASTDALTFGRPLASPPGRGAEYQPVTRFSNISETTVLQSHPPYQPSLSNSHHLTLAFVDLTGKPVPDVNIAAIQGSGPGSDFGSGFASSYISNSTPPKDLEGFHIFVPPTISSLTVKIASGFCKPCTQTLPLDGTPRQTLTIPVEPNKPLRGRILDSNAKPLPDATVMLSLNSDGAPDRTNGGPPSRVSGNNSDLDLRTTTDSDGRFSFPGAPDECFATLRHNDLLYHSDQPPMPPEPIGPNDRDIVIHVPASGALLIRLPDPLSLPRDFKVDLLSSDPLAAGPFTLGYDPTLHALVSAAIPPGHYHLPADLFPAWGDLSAHDIQITLHQTATLDLRDQPRAPWAAGTTQNLSLRVERDGKPVSGAEVAIFADGLPVEVMRNRLADYLNAPVDADLRPLINKLLPAANIVLDLLPKSSDDPVVGPRIVSLRHSLTIALNSQDNLTLLATDLSPDDGTIHFTARAGQTCVAVARLRGTALGVQTFAVPVVPAGQDAPVLRLALQPLRPLIIHAPPPPANPNGRPNPPTSFTLDLPSTMESRALLRSLDNDFRWNVGPYGNRPATLTFRRTANGLSFDGLVINTTLITQPLNSPSPLRITIPEGTGTYEFTPPAPPQ